MRTYEEALKDFTPEEQREIQAGTKAMLAEIKQARNAVRAVEPAMLRTAQPSETL